ncbi:MAG: hypothetical protein O2904_05170, partial [bacterium]|nr:hypothetical protein [bacterium]
PQEIVEKDGAYTVQEKKEADVDSSEEGREITKEQQEKFNKDALEQFAKNGSFVNVLASGGIEAGSNLLANANEKYLAADTDTQAAIQLILIEATRTQKTKVTFGTEGIEIGNKNLGERLKEAGDLMEVLTILLTSLFERLADGSIKQRKGSETLGDTPTEIAIETKITDAEKKLGTLIKTPLSDGATPQEQLARDNEIKVLKEEIVSLKRQLEEVRVFGHTTEDLREELAKHPEFNSEILNVTLFPENVSIEIEFKTDQAKKDAAEVLSSFKMKTGEGYLSIKDGEPENSLMLTPSASLQQQVDSSLDIYVTNDSGNLVLSKPDGSATDSTEEGAKEPETAEAQEIPQLIQESRKVVGSSSVEINRLATDAVSEQSSDTGIDVSEQLESIKSEVTKIEGSFATADLDATKMEVVLATANATLAKLETPMKLEISNISPTNISINLVDLDKDTSNAQNERSQRKDDGLEKSERFLEIDETEAVSSALKNWVNDKSIRPGEPRYESLFKATTILLEANAKENGFKPLASANYVLRVLPLYAGEGYEVTLAIRPEYKEERRKMKGLNHNLDTVGITKFDKDGNIISAKQFFSAQGLKVNDQLVLDHVRVSEKENLKNALKEGYSVSIDDNSKSIVVKDPSGKKIGEQYFPDWNTFSRDRFTINTILSHIEQKI